MPVIVSAFPAEGAATVTAPLELIVSALVAAPEPTASVEPLEGADTVPLPAAANVRAAAPEELFATKPLEPATAPTVSATPLAGAFIVMLPAVTFSAVAPA